MSVNGWTPVRDEAGRVVRMEWSSAALGAEQATDSQTGSVLKRSCANPGCGREFQVNRHHPAEHSYCSPTCRKAVWEARQMALPCVKRPSEKAKHARLSRQGLLLLGRLQKGPASNLELVQAGAGFRYSARIHEARELGHDIRLIEQDHETGRTVYALFIDGEVVK